MDDTQFNNLAHFELKLSTGYTIQLWVDAEESVKAKWVEAERLDGSTLVLKIFAKKPRAEKKANK